MSKTITLFLAFLYCFLNSFSQSFTSGSLVVCRVGDGINALSTSAAPVFLDEYSALGTILQNISLPTVASGSNHILTLSGSATSEGLITRSADKRYILIAGYDAAPGTAAVAATAGSSINRVVGRVAVNGSADITTALPDFASGGNARSAVSNDGINLWISGAVGGVRYTTLGATTSLQLDNTVTNSRQVNIFNGQLYFSTGSASFRLASIGTGLPVTVGQTSIELPGIPTSTGSPYSFFFADLNAGVPGVDVLYVADDGTGITKYSFDGVTWLSNGTVSGGVRGLIGIVNGTSVTLYATTTATSGNSIVSITDASGYNGSFTGTAVPFVTAPVNTAFRGIALSPESTAGINDISDDIEFSLAPNPSTNSLKVFTNKNSPFQIEIITMLGERVYALPSTGKQTEIDISGLTQGIYFVSVSIGGELEWLKFIKQ